MGRYFFAGTCASGFVAFLGFFLETHGQPGAINMALAFVIFGIFGLCFTIAAVCGGDW